MSNPPSERLSILQAAMVVARRDFFAILLSRAFFFFLLGPLFPLAVGGLAGGIGAKVESGTAAPQIGIAMAAADVTAMMAARDRLEETLGRAVPKMVVLGRLKPGQSYDAAGTLARREGNLAAVVTGSPAHPELIATPERLEYWSGPIGLIAADAQGTARKLPEVATRAVAASGANEQRGRLRTAQSAQLLLFLLTMLLAGMVLSNLVEEKANKVIEILAASIPMDAVFLGKLFAMLAVSLVGITVWGSAIGAFIAVSGSEALAGGVLDYRGLPSPAVGWPAFLALGIAYFSVSYLLLGSVFLAIGSLATTVREVQTLSMPVTMMQVLLFFLANLAMADNGGWIAWAATAFPFSSPYTMLARAAMEPQLWPHAVGLAWDLAWVAVCIRVGSALFRKRVMQSGPRKVKRSRWKRPVAASASTP